MSEPFVIIEHDKIGFPANKFTIDYTNHRGERAFRHIEIECFFYGESSFHPEGVKLFLCAMDLDKKARRHFLVEDIHKWEQLKAGGF